MELLQSILLAIIQGITEFLPVSSSGHLALFQNFFGNIDVSFDILLHLATLLSIFVYFRKDIGSLISDFLSFKTQTENFRLVLLLVVATIPAAIIGFFLKALIDKYFSNLVVIGFGFAISGLFLVLASSKLNSKKQKISLKDSVLIGISQALALIPGISRAGSTTSTGILLGISKEKALRFSFLLAIPVIAGASLLKITELNFSFLLLIPFFLAFLIGLASIHIFLKLIRIKNLAYFAIYCWLLAIITFSIYLF